MFKIVTDPSENFISFDTLKALEEALKFIENQED